MMPILVVFLIFLSLILAKVEIAYIKDLEHVKNSKFCQVQGELIGYAKSFSDGDDLNVTYSWPIIKENSSNESVSLNILNSDQRLEIGKEYTVIYLPNTKLAEIVQ